MHNDAMVTYKQSETFKKSPYGFDHKAYKAWKECFDTWVIPLAIDIANLESDNKNLKKIIDRYTTKENL
jgi:hypothetical protein